MYQFYMNEEEGWFVQVYNDGDITEEYARHKIDILTEGKSSEFVQVCLALDLYDFAQAILPLNVPDSVMRVWKSNTMTVERSRTYTAEAMEPYYAVDVVNTDDKVDLRGK